MDLYVFSSVDWLPNIVNITRVVYDYSQHVRNNCVKHCGPNQNMLYMLIEVKFKQSY